MGGHRSRHGVRVVSLKKSSSGTAARTIVFVTFESEFAPLGGLAAVMKVLPKRMAQVDKGECFTIAPLFRHITSCKPTVFQEIHSTGHTFSLIFGVERHEVEVFEHRDRNGFTTVLLDSPAFFNSPCNCDDPADPQKPCNPYRDPTHPDQLLQDALFFCAAVPKTLLALGKTQNLILNLQDWETACVALTRRQEPGMVSATCVLTLHNPYDMPVTNEDIKKISAKRAAGETVLSKMIPFLDGPLCTVSENFAAEMIRDPLHTKVYVPYLQRQFKKKGIIGINNGLFGKLDFPQNAIDAASQGDRQHLLREKRKRREAMVKVLQEYTPSQAWGRLDWADFDGPVFLMFGRDDPRQKGYDLAAAAIQNIPKGKAKYIFTPIPGDERLAGLNFLKALAKDRPGEVKVFPFRIAKGYLELQRGSSFLVMCSLYEPFGGATEGYAVATPVLARATGGLIQQVTPYPSRCCNRTVRRLVKPFHADLDAPTGFLFHEPELPSSDVIAGWKTIADCAYWPAGDRIADRMGTRLFDAMAREATQAFLDAIELYTNDQVSYANMIYNGFKMLDHFSWDHTVQEYQALYASTIR